MDHYSDSQPSGLGTFFRGFLSGALNGAVMMGIVAGLSFLPIFGGGLAAHFLVTASMMVLATGIFGGAMGVKRALFDAPHKAPSTTYVPVPVQGISGPALAPAVSLETSEHQTAPAKSWVAQTGRSEGTQSRIQEILNRGDLSDHDRASAILAAREAADGQKSIA